MKAKAAKLDQIQRWMQSVIMHPGDVEESLACPEARQHLQVSLEELEDVMTRSRALSAADRLGIYIDAYHERLMECLREEFPATGHALGQELFDALAFGYLQRYPSRSYTLGQLGASLSTFLDETRLHAQEAPEGAGPAWPQFVVDLARFERLLREVYDAPGNEGGRAADVARWAQSAVPDWKSLRLKLAPMLRIEPFDHDVHAYWRAFKDDQLPPVPPPRITYLAIHRRQFLVTADELSATQFGLLTLLKEGRTLFEAIEHLTDRPGGLEPEGDELRRWFASWAASGFFDSPAEAP